MKCVVLLADSDEIIVTVFQSQYLFENNLLYLKLNINIKDYRRLSKIQESSLVKCPEGIPDQ